ncbi:DUF1788 domain-containing protein [Schaalia naturae]|jgi:hypothetical protein|uniref:DUF1788 domain-containing protein n=1 Tax=Schaalia naturae TaxID=635203 RepID=A0ABW2SP90_9ACTO
MSWYDDTVAVAKAASVRDLGQEESQIAQVLASDDFLHQRGRLSGVPFYVWAYPATRELEARQACARLRTRLRTEHGLTVVVIDLYDLMIDVLRGTGMLDRILLMEPSLDPEDFRVAVQRMLTPERHLAPRILQRIQEEPGSDLVFLTGVGHAFPFIRSHTVLGALESVATGVPVLLFFPGQYTQSPETGSALILFGTEPDQYYRASSILDQIP